VQTKIDTLTSERKALLAEGVRDKHFNWGSLLLALGVAIAIEGPVNTYLRTGKLFPGPHLYAGAGIVVLWAAAAACVPQMQKGNDTARSAHIALNAINLGLFAWQARAGVLSACWLLRKHVLTCACAAGADGARDSGQGLSVYVLVRCLSERRMSERRLSAAWRRSGLTQACLRIFQAVNAPSCRRGCARSSNMTVPPPCASRIASCVISGSADEDIRPTSAEQPPQTAPPQTLPPSPGFLGRSSPWRARCTPC
jgi:hypothetical protein